MGGSPRVLIENAVGFYLVYHGSKVKRLETIEGNDQVWRVVLANGGRYTETRGAKVQIRRRPRRSA